MTTGTVAGVCLGGDGVAPSGSGDRVRSGGMSVGVGSGISACHGLRGVWLESALFGFGIEVALDAFLGWRIGMSGCVD